MKFLYTLTVFCGFMSICGADVPEAYQAQSVQAAAEIINGEQSEESEGLKCPICWDAIADHEALYFYHDNETENIVSGQSNRRHLFHGGCLLESFKNKLECPICRAQLPKDFKDIYGLFLRYLNLEITSDALILEVDGFKSIHSEKTAVGQRLSIFIMQCVNGLVVTENKENCLIKAAVHNDVRMAEFLLINGADSAFTTQEGLTVLQVAVCKGQVKLVECLLQVPAIKATINDQHVETGNGLLHLLVMNYKSEKNAEYKATFDCLVGHGIDVSLKNNGEFTVLQMAVCWDHVELVKHFLQIPAIKATINDQHVETGNGLLHLLVINYKSEKDAEYKGVCDSLVIHGIDLSLKNNDEFTVLQMAVAIGCVELVEHFLKVPAIKATINDQRVETGNGLLHLLVMNYKSEKAAEYKATFDCLVGHGIDLSLKNNDELTVLQLAVAIGCVELVEHFLKVPAIKATMNDKHPVADNGLLHLALGNYKSEKAAEYKGVCDSLVIHGIDVSLKNNQEFTALQVAVVVGCVELVEHLLLIPELKATINDKHPGIGSGLLHLIGANYKAAKDANYKAAVDCLVDNGIDVTLKNSNGLLAWERALKSGHKNLAEYMKSKVSPAQLEVFEQEEAVMYEGVAQLFGAD